MVVADDHPLVLGGLEQLCQVEEDLELVTACASGREALEAIRRDRPDVAVLDIRMPEMSGLEVARQLAAEPDAATRIVLLTGAIDEDEVLEAVRLGVRGVLLKEMAPRLLVECVRKVHAGERWIERGSFSGALDRAARRDQSASEVARVLTPRELEVVRLVGRGLRNREIAARLFVSEGTVKVHLHRVFGKLGVSTRSALARYAMEKGLG